MTKTIKRVLAATLCTAALATAASATTLRISVTNNQADGGFSITPLYLGFHDGTFDAFNEGEAASAGVQTIAETGMPGVVAGERVAVDPDSSGAVLASPSGPPPVQPSETVAANITFNASEAVYLTYLSMLLPSNDTFIGNDDPLAYQLFDDSGAFVGNQTIVVNGTDIWDAGTEVNGLEGSAFVAGQDITAGDDENGVITQATDLSVFAGAELATGDFLGDVALLDFASNREDFTLVTIEISQVPVPASAPLLLGALGFMAWRSRRKAANA